MRCESGPCMARQGRYAQTKKMRFENFNNWSVFGDAIFGPRRTNARRVTAGLCVAIQVPARAQTRRIGRKNGTRNNEN
jgi:hypothetical protein